MQILKHESSYYQTTGFKWRQRIGFGISDYACNLAYLLANTYLLFYYTNCAGISGAAGFMFVVTKFIDAVTDYVVGAMIDHTDTKMGRYRPWMLFGAPVLAVGMVLLFSVPTGWEAGAKLAWAYITYIFFWVYIGKYPIDTYCYSIILESGGAYQDIDHPAGFCESGILNLFSVCDSNGIFFRGITGCRRG